METKSKTSTSMPPPNVPKIKTSVPEDYKSDDSLFSVVSTKEVVVKDEKSGIVLIEKHTPSVTSGSVGRRSLDSISITSAATVDSQATLIYDWHTLGRIYKQDKSDSSKHLYTRKPLAQLRKENGTSDNKVLSSQSSSGSSNDIISPSLHTQDTIPDCEIPDHLSKLSCEEISQRLQQYGELPGPIITSTKQVYLKRLTSLEANPGLISLSSKTPDFPPELRQALEGKFDASHLPMIEAKMVEEFSAASSSNKQWREGIVKSSFTYLLLDPRVSANLPLRAKEMTDLEVFKTFICSIFYIGKGKRARPYCHLHEAVRQMNKANANNSCKSNKKVEQVIEIWKAGLGVVSLHCFQSVIPVEAYTREACMIEAIGIHKLTNIKRGDFYGVSSTWSMQLRRQVGVYLLQKALQIFLADGERQIFVKTLWRILFVLVISSESKAVSSAYLEFVSLAVKLKVCSSRHITRSDISTLDILSVILSFSYLWISLRGGKRRRTRSMEKSKRKSSRRRSSETTSAGERDEELEKEQEHQKEEQKAQQQ
ncbi:hypothetical protein EGW08_007656 [Elysia chlorotica]|uniref:LEM domain-containing protein n=1 Tax=Elysia chlorotica TaxID=188477 RepID=A0A3S0ZS62_ELYCH|nr:hypothetical protein EGW08_007656 [Elysia chlorotica]